VRALSLTDQALKDLGDKEGRKGGLREIGRKWGGGGERIREGLRDGGRHKGKATIKRSVECPLLTHIQTHSHNLLSIYHSVLSVSHTLLSLTYCEGSSFSSYS
jgi:hypothetical protein